MQSQPTKPEERAWLRDQLAMAALPAVIAGLPLDDHEYVLSGVIGGRRVSKAAYMYADAMLVARDA